MENILSIRDLRVKFNHDVLAIDGVNMDIPEAATVVVAGESGSGKSITALSITGLLPPGGQIVSGKVLFRGRDVLKMRQQELTSFRGRQVAYIFQEPSAYLNPVLSVGEQISETIMVHQHMARAQAVAEALRLLGEVKIADPRRVFHDYPHQLSGGMNQRAFIAMNLACCPNLLIADEPTTALDVTIEAEIIKLLCELKQKMGFTLLFITHNLSIAKKIAERIYIMHRGKVVEEGTVAEIFNTPKHMHTRELIEAYEKIGKL